MELIGQYDGLLSKQQDPTYRNVIEYSCGIKAISMQLNELSGKKVVFAMGSTKVGKSTILNALISGSGAMARDEDCNIVAS